MIATHTQQTQMPIIISTSSTVQTDTQTLHNNSTQTKTFHTTRATQTSPQNSRAVQTDHMLNDTSAIDSTDSSISPEVLGEVVASINLDNSKRKRKIHNKDHSSDNQVSSKQRKRVSS